MTTNDNWYSLSSALMLVIVCLIIMIPVAIIEKRLDKERVELLRPYASIALTNAAYQLERYNRELRDNAELFFWLMSENRRLQLESELRKRFGTNLVIQTPIHKSK